MTFKGKGWGGRGTLHILFPGSQALSITTFQRKMWSSKKVTCAGYIMSKKKSHDSDLFFLTPEPMVNYSTLYHLQTIKSVEMMGIDNSCIGLWYARQISSFRTKGLFCSDFEIAGHCQLSSYHLSSTIGTLLSQGRRISPFPMSLQCGVQRLVPLASCGMTHRAIPAPELPVGSAEASVVTACTTKVPPPAQLHHPHSSTDISPKSTSLSTYDM